ncbi:MAG TPA: DNA-protecting protein DprA, partial [Firmicutes bacterium]|nr:DNA-protecting protein DprA [Bacillota bacterium]
MKWSPRQYLIAFNMIPGIGGRRLLAIHDHFGSLERAWQAPGEELQRIEGIGPKTAESVCALRASICPEVEERWAQGLGAEVITLRDNSYPHYLRRLAVPPPVLYVLGQLPAETGVAVVGTRKPSRIGIAQAQQFSAHLVRQGLAVISGLARGIDYFAHEQVVQMQGRTVAVLGSNIGQVYPSEHRKLARQIAQKGAVISEFSSRCPTVPGNFPRRNRVIAGCSKGVLVVQAGAKSGSIHTADWALELGIDVWSIPGEISDPLRAGNHRLIKQGAYLASSPEDVERSLQREPVTEKVGVEELYQAGH